MKEQCRKKNRSKQICFNACLTQTNVTQRGELKFLTVLRGDLLQSRSDWIHLSSWINSFLLDQSLLKSQLTAKIQVQGLRKNKREHPGHWKPLSSRKKKKKWKSSIPKLVTFPQFWQFHHHYQAEKSISFPHSHLVKSLKCCRPLTRLNRKHVLITQLF